MDDLALGAFVNENYSALNVYTSKDIIGYEYPNSNFWKLCKQRKRWAKGFYQVLNASKGKEIFGKVCFHGLVYHCNWIINWLIVILLVLLNVKIAGVYILLVALIITYREPQMLFWGVIYQFIFPIFHVVWIYYLIKGEIILIMDETFLKAKILTNGVIFSDEAIKIARNTNAKGQNLVYNAPQNLSGFRPQELLIIHDDGYETVSSCVASCTESPVMIDYIDNRLVAVIDGKCVENITIEFVKEPNYYTKKLSNGSKAKKYVSACGYDELNILPWLGCNISSGCLFCGTNSIAKMNADDILTADSISNHHAWEKNKLEYLKLLNEAIDIAKILIVTLIICM